MTSVLPSLRLVRSRSFFIVAAVVVLLLVAAGGVYAYDSGRDGTIAKGISIGGGDVGGLKAPAAQERLPAGGRGAPARRAPGAAQPPGRRPLPRPPLHADAPPGARGRRHRRLGRRGPRPLARRQ